MVSCLFNLVLTLYLSLLLNTIFNVNNASSSAVVIVIITVSEMLLVLLVAIPIFYWPVRIGWKVIINLRFSSVYPFFWCFASKKKKKKPFFYCLHYNFDVIKQKVIKQEKTKKKWTEIKTKKVEAGKKLSD